MRALRAAFLAAILTSIASAAILPGRLALGFFSQPSGGGQSLVFSYPSGFTSVHSDFTFPNGDSAFADPNIDVSIAGAHVAGAAWYNTKQTITSFTTEFTFAITNGAYGFNFVIQNDSRGTGASADANGIGYFTYTYNVPDNAVHNSVALVFNNTTNTTGAWVGTNHSLVGLYIDGGPFINGGIFPNQDLAPQGINLNAGDVMDAQVTYDGSNLTILLTDTTSGAKATFSWPVNIPSIVGASTAYVGFTGGGVSGTSAGPSTLNSWTWYNGYNTELPAPTFSPSPGQYTASQTVSISGPSGATIYYTTNGTPPTTSSSTYSTPLTVSANEAIQAIAVKSNYTTSASALGNYLIQSAASPTINFPSGFSGTGLIQTAAAAAISGSNIVITDGVNHGEFGSAFYVAPVNISSFSTVFTAAYTSSVNGAHNGFSFVIQNQGQNAYYGNSIGLTAGPSSGATSATLSSAWSGSTGSRLIEFTDNETRTTTLTNGSTAISWTGGLTNSVGASVEVVRTGNSVVSGGPYAFGAGNSAAVAWGVEGIGNSVAVSFDQWQDKLILSVDGVETNTVAISGINWGVNTDQVTLTYSGTTLAVTLKDTVTLATFTQNFTVDIPTDVGASTAYVGFTGAAYDSSVGQEITSWTY